jgi:hypothetical protein
VGQKEGLRQVQKCWAGRVGGAPPACTCSILPGSRSPCLYPTHAQAGEGCRGFAVLALQPPEGKGFGWRDRDKDEQHQPFKE